MTRGDGRANGNEPFALPELRANYADDLADLDKLTTDPPKLRQTPNPRF